MDSIIVADTGAIISLALVSQLNLLNYRYSKVLIPTAVWHELMNQASDFNLLEIASFARRY
jgi:predicted nucleic acid-binding protein